MGLFKNSFSTSWYHYPEVRNNFANISAKTKMFSKNCWCTAQGTRYFRFMQKTRHQKSHTSVPLSKSEKCNLGWTKLPDSKHSSKSLKNNSASSKVKVMPTFFAFCSQLCVKFLIQTLERTKKVLAIFIMRLLFVQVNLKSNTFLENCSLKC